MIILSRKDSDPYERERHHEDCEQVDFWLDDDTLAPDDDLPEWFQFCPACAHQYAMWADIIEQTATADSAGDPRYGELALRGMALEKRVLEFHYPIYLLSPYDAELVEIVNNERNKLDAQDAYWRMKNAESKGK